MRCPADHKNLVVRNAEGGHVGYLCAACSGVWLPEKFISSIKHTKDFDPVSLNSLLKSIASIKSELSCPQNCGSLFLSSVDGLEIDWCAKCKGIWFNKGELSSFLNQYPPVVESESKAVKALGIVEVLGYAVELFVH